MRPIRCLAMLAVCCTIGCAPRTGVETAADRGPTLKVVPAAEWPVLTDDEDLESLVRAAAISVEFFNRLPPDRQFRFGTVTRTAGELSRGLQDFVEIVGANEPGPDRDRALKTEFVLLRSVGRDRRGEVLFTGYFEPLLDGRREAEEDFTHPIYETPDDLLTIRLGDFGVEEGPDRLVGRVDDSRVVPYWERDAIDCEEVLTDSARALAYLADPLDAFFLHVQGSGTIVFPDGEHLRAGYATTNGRPYRSIGRLLIDEGLVSKEAMSMQAIVAFLEEHPEELRRVLSYNPSYVFFRALPSAGGPLGCYEAPLTARRSIATDRRLFPAPVMAWVSATIPTLDGEDEEIARFVLNQDTGGSIRGPGRVDLFLGLGDEAGDIAGRTKHLGELYFLLPKAGE